MGKRVGGNDEAHEVPLERTRVWREDLVGFKTLHDGQKLWCYMSPHEHDELDDGERLNILAPFLLGDVPTGASPAGGVAEGSTDGMVPCVSQPTSPSGTTMAGKGSREAEDTVLYI